MKKDRGGGVKGRDALLHFALLLVGEAGGELGWSEGEAQLVPVGRIR